ncbi:MAG TPA: DUF1592 domain-containing protein, partial [Polyangiaceae bacterium]
MTRSIAKAVGGFWLATTVACTAIIAEPNDRGPGAPGSGTPGDPSNPTNPVPPPTGGGTGTGVPADPYAAGPMPMRRLNRREYNNTVRDLLSVATKPADAFPADLDPDFIFHRAGLVSSLDADRLREAAETLASAANVTTLAPCATTGGDPTCAHKFVETFGLRAYRRPPLAAEIDRLMALYQVGRTTLMLDYAGAIKLLIEAMLQSPAFIYRWELGPNAPTLEGQVVRLGPYEVASRLSYFLWRSMPDQQLFAAAAANQLSTDADLEQQARRMLADTKGRETVGSFFGEWLSLEQVPERPKDTTLYPEFNDALKAAMTAEMQNFVSNVVFEGDGRLSSLLTATYSYVNQPLAKLYGLTSTTTTNLQKTELNPAERLGLLTQPAFLTVTGATDGSNPVKRGRKVYERLLCGTLPPPPPNVPPPKPPSAGGTTRDRFVEHDMQACAAGCHTLMDPIGFGFEHYDGIGKYRTLDNGLPVNSASKIQLDGAAQNFKDAIELSRLLADSAEVRNCFGP